jgi:hypothetical protein
MRLPRFRQVREGGGRARRRLLPPVIESLEGRVVLSLTTVGSEFRVNTTTADQQFNPAVAVDPAGDTVVAYQSGTEYNGSSPYDIKVQRYNSSGVAQGGEITVNTTLTDTQIQPAIAIDADGDFVVAWASYQNGNYDIFAQRFNAAGAKQGGEIAVNSTKAGGQVQPSVAMDAAGNFVITWTSGQGVGGSNEVIFQRYNSSGVAQGPETQANNTTGGSQNNPAVAMDGSGNFVIAWQSVEASTEIRFRRFNAAGNAFAGDAVANISAGDQANPAIAMEPTGEFVIAWDGNGPGDAQGIFFRRYNASGVGQDAADVRANSTLNNATAPTIGINSRGDFAIAWTNNDASGTGVFAQQFFATGSKSGPEFRANTTTAGSQIEATLGSNSDGDIFVAWRSDGQDGSGAGVYAQRYQTNLHAPTTTGISNVNVLEDAANTVINLVNNFNDEEDGAAGLTYSITGNTNPGLFTSASINNGNANHPLTLDYAPNASGSSTITIRATDTTGFTVDATFTVNVAAVNDAPTLNAISNLSINQNASLQTVNLAGISAGGGESQVLTVTAVSSNPGLIPNPTVTYTSPNATGSLSFTPAAGQFGVAVITVTVKDNGGTSNGGVDTTTRTFTVTVNGAPTSNSQSVTTNQGTAKPITLTGSDPESEPLTYIITASPAHGTLSGTAPNLTYTPNAGYFGPDSFQFKTNDGHQDGNIGTVSINVIGAPTANAQAVNVAHNTATAVTLTGSDPNTPPLSLTYLVTANPAHGTLSGTAPNLTYTPNAGYFGPDSFQFKVNNGSLDSNIATIALNVAPPSNRPPKANDDTASTNDQAPVTVQVLDNDTDPDLPGDTLTVIAVGTPSPNVGTVTFTGTTVTYTPVANTHGPIVFSYTIRDSAGELSTANVTVTVTDITAPSVVDLIVHWGGRSASVMSLGRALPWDNITAIDAVFSEDVAVAQGNLALTGVNIPSYATNGFSYIANTRTARWTFPTALGADRLIFTLDGHSGAGVKDVSGNLLTGGDFLKSLAILPGDHNGDGVVNTQDLLGVRNEMPGFGSPPTSFGDINGDGVVDINDYNVVKRKIGTRLP